MVRPLEKSQALRLNIHRPCEQQSVPRYCIQRRVDARAPKTGFVTALSTANTGNNLNVHRRAWMNCATFTYNTPQQQDQLLHTP